MHSHKSSCHYILESKNPRTAKIRVENAEMKGEVAELRNALRESSNITRTET
eukprot:SAG31_NODE_23928_length_492_cov_1.763359_1_plen_51_part_10